MLTKRVKTINIFGKKSETNDNTNNLIKDMALAFKHYEQAYFSKYEKELNAEQIKSWRSGFIAGYTGFN